ncbi:MAG: CBS domain-containing protein, partial [bacterium]
NGFWEGKEVKITKVKEILKAKKETPSLIFVNPKDKLTKAVKLMHQYNISQLPVIENNKLIGSLDEASLMKFSHDGINFAEQEISAVMGKSLPTMEEDVDMAEAYRLLLSGTSGLIITRNKFPVGVITRVDLINYWITQKG